VKVLKLVDMHREVLGYGLASPVDPRQHAELVAKALEARARVRERVRNENLATYVELFDRDRYLASMTVSENLLFGMARDPAFQPANLPTNPEVLALLRDVGLLDDLYAAGARVASLMVEIFADVSPDSELFEQYSFISAEDLPEFQALLSKLGNGGVGAIPEKFRPRLLALTFRLVLSRHRLGVIDDAMQRRIVEARAEFGRRFANRDVVEFLDPDAFNSALSLQDNILFGRVSLEQANAQARVTALVRDVASEAGMEPELVRAGLGFEVGTAGSRLSYSERQRIAIARGILKNPDILVFNEATSGLDPSTELRVLRNVLGWAKGRTVLWALGRAELAREFDRVLVFEEGQVVEEGRYSELEQGGSALTRLVA
jgi:ABC-type branched-subunit amino acid transport system ATPase component